MSMKSFAQQARDAANTALAKAKDEFEIVKDKMKTELGEEAEELPLTVGESLRRYATCDDLERLRGLLSCGADPDDCDNTFSNTPFYEAVIRGGSGMATAKLLLEYGANPRVVDVEKNVPLLHRCAVYGEHLCANYHLYQGKEVGWVQFRVRWSMVQGKEGS